MRCLIEVSASNVRTEEQVVIVAGVVTMVLGSVYESIYSADPKLLVLRSDVELSGSTDEINNDIVGHLTKFTALEGIQVLCHFIDPDADMSERQIH